MFTVLRLFLLRWVAARTLGGVVAAVLGGAIPLAVVLKLFGVPLLLVLAAIGVPVGAVLSLLRLPVRIVLGVVGVVGTLAAAAFTVGVLVLKLFVVALAAGVIIWLVLWLVRRRARRAPAPVVTQPIVQRLV